MTGDLTGSREQQERHPDSWPLLSLIVPVLNEASQLPALIRHLYLWQALGCEVLLVDGGSDDQSVALAVSAGFRVISSQQGRARQMNAGAAQAKGDILVFLHADTRLPPDADQLIWQACGTHLWGRFDVRLTGDALMLRVIAFMMNVRSRLTGIATGDQAIFVVRKLFASVGGFPDQPLMEDIEISKRLRRIHSPCCIRAQVTTSGRRWQRRGIWRTIWLMWRLRLAYWLGVSAQRLAKEYR